MSPKINSILPGWNSKTPPATLGRDRKKFRRRSPSGSLSSILPSLVCNSLQNTLDILWDPKLPENKPESLRSILDEVAGWEFCYFVNIISIPPEQHNVCNYIFRAPNKDELAESLLSERVQVWRNIPSLSKYTTLQKLWDQFVRGANSLDLTPTFSNCICILTPTD